MEICAGDSKSLSSDIGRVSDALNHKASSLGFSTRWKYPFAEYVMFGALRKVHYLIDEP